MPTLEDDLKIIQNAVYGKDMRLAISDALSQGWTALTIMMDAVDNLNERVDSLYDGNGGTADPDNPDNPPQTSSQVYILVANLDINVVVSIGSSIGEATII